MDLKVDVPPGVRSGGVTSFKSTSYSRATYLYSDVETKFLSVVPVLSVVPGVKTTKEYRKNKRRNTS